MVYLARNESWTITELRSQQFCRILLLVKTWSISGALELITLVGVSSNYDSWYVSVTDFSWPAPFQSGSLIGYLCLDETVSVADYTEPITRQHSMRPKRSASFASLERIERRCAAHIRYSVPWVVAVVSLIFVALIVDFFNKLCLRFVLFNEANRLYLDVCCSR